MAYHSAAEGSSAAKKGLPATSRISGGFSSGGEGAAMQAQTAKARVTSTSKILPRLESLGIVGDKPAVVLDIGHSYTKCGFAGEFCPRAIIPTEYFTCDSSQRKEMKRLFRIEMEHGTFSAHVDDKAISGLLQNIYFRHLLAMPKERRVVVVESVLTPCSYRDQLARILFEQLDVPSVLFAPSHVLACFPYGAQHAVVVDVGTAETIVIPSYESEAMLNCWEASPSGTAAVYSNLRKLLLEHGKIRMTNGIVDPVTADQLTVGVLEDITLRLCFSTTLNRGRQIQDCDNSSELQFQPPPDANYQLNAGKTLIVPGFVRESACEVLFRYDPDVKSIPQLILDSVLRCPIDMRKPLLERLLVVGGGALIVGFLSRLKAELLELLCGERYRARLPITTVKFYRFNRAPIESYAQWLGGSLFGSLEVLPYRSMTREQWLKAKSVPDWTSKICETFTSLGEHVTGS